MPLPGLRISGFGRDLSGCSLRFHLGAGFTFVHDIDAQEDQYDRQPCGPKLIALDIIRNRKADSAGTDHPQDR